MALPDTPEVTSLGSFGQCQSCPGSEAPKVCCPIPACPLPPRGAAGGTVNPDRQEARQSGHCGPGKQRHRKPRPPRPPARERRAPVWAQTGKGQGSARGKREPAALQ